MRSLVLFFSGLATYIAVLILSQRMFAAQSRAAQSHFFWR